MSAPPPPPPPPPEVEWGQLEMVKPKFIDEMIMDFPTGYQDLQRRTQKEENILVNMRERQHVQRERLAKRHIEEFQEHMQDVVDSIDFEALHTYLPPTRLETVLHPQSLEFLKSANVPGQTRPLDLLPADKRRVLIDLDQFVTNHSNLSPDERKSFESLSIIELSKEIGKMSASVRRDMNNEVEEMLMFHQVEKEPYQKTLQKAVSRFDNSATYTAPSEPKVKFAMDQPNRPPPINTNAHAPERDHREPKSALSASGTPRSATFPNDARTSGPHVNFAMDPRTRPSDTQGTSKGNNNSRRSSFNVFDPDRRRPSDQVSPTAVEPPRGPRQSGPWKQQQQQSNAPWVPISGFNFSTDQRNPYDRREKDIDSYRPSSRHQQQGGSESAWDQPQDNYHSNDRARQGSEPGHNQSNYRGNRSTYRGRGRGSARRGSTNFRGRGGRGDYDNRNYNSKREYYNERRNSREDYRSSGY